MEELSLCSLPQKYVLTAILGLTVKRCLSHIMGGLTKEVMFSKCQSFQQYLREEILSTW